MSMTLSQKQRIINRLLAGEIVYKVCGKAYKVINPSLELMIEADELYVETVHENRFQLWYSTDELQHLIIKHRVGSKDPFVKLKKYDKDLETLKLLLFQE